MDLYNGHSIEKERFNTLGESLRQDKQLQLTLDYLKQHELQEELEVS